MTASLQCRFALAIENGRVETSVAPTTLHEECAGGDCSCICHRPEKRPKKASVGTVLCACGCGGLTGREFCPGHDAKLKSRLAVDAAAGDAWAYAELVARDWHRLHHAALAKAPRASKDQARKIYEGYTKQELITVRNNERRGL